MNTGSLVWVENSDRKHASGDDALWIPTTVESRQDNPDEDSYTISVSINGKKITAKLNKTTLESDQVKQRHPVLNAFQEDILDIPYLNEPEVLSFLKARYERGYIYTYSGSVLVVFNPLRQIHPEEGGLKLIREFTNDIIEECANEYQSVVALIQEQQPPSTPGRSPVHPPARSININKHSILVSGESGSGKTETYKLVIRSLGDSIHTENVLPEVKAFHESILEKLQIINRILDSFGNAKTATTSNSSRCGKLLTLSFGNKTNLLDCTISTYLLESSRVFTQQAGERNYNIFYELVAGCEEADRDQLLLLQSPGDYHYLSQGGVLNRAEVSTYTAQFDELQKNFEKMRFNPTHVRDLQRTLVGILSLGQLRCGGGDLTEGENATMWAAGARLLGLDKNELMRLLTIKTIVTPLRETIQLQVTPQYVEIGRDAICKLIYRTLFDWLVHELNAILAFQLEEERPQGLFAFLDEGGSPLPGLLGPETPRTPTINRTPSTSAMKRILSQRTMSASNMNILSPSAASLATPTKTRSRRLEVDTSQTVTTQISVIDIFGFDSFQFNSIDQLCINFANEALQQLFITNMFKLEISLYEKECISFDKLEYVDNKDSLEFISQGIFKVLDDQCRLPNPTDKRFATQLYRDYERHPLFSGSALQQSEGKFSVRHFVGPVEYSSTGFVNKNLDHIPADTFRILASSSNPLLASLFPENFAQPKDLGVDATLAQRKAAQALRQQQQQQSESAPLRTVKPGTSLVTHFKLELSLLLKEVESTSAHYIKCIKPHDARHADLLAPVPPPLQAGKTFSNVKFNQIKVSEQLRNGGILEAIRIARSGYRTKQSYFDFYNRYRVIADDIEDSFEGPIHIYQTMGLAGAKALCQALLAVLSVNKTKKRGSKKFGDMFERIQSKSVRNLDQLLAGSPGRQKSFALSRADRGLSFSAAVIQAYSVEDGIVDDANVQFGKTRIFLKKREFDYLEIFRNKFLNIKVTMIQTVWRCYFWRSEFECIHYAIKLIQRLYRGYFARKQVYIKKAERRLAITLQRKFRRARFRRCVVKAQALMRRMMAQVAVNKMREERLRMLAAYGQFMVAREMRMHRRQRLATVTDHLVGLHVAPSQMSDDSQNFSIARLIDSVGDGMLGYSVLPCNFKLLQVIHRAPPVAVAIQQCVADHLHISQGISGIFQSHTVRRGAETVDFDLLYRRFSLELSQVFAVSPHLDEQREDAVIDVEDTNNISLVHGKLDRLQDHEDVRRTMDQIRDSAQQAVKRIMPAAALLDVNSLLHFSTVGRMMGPAVWGTVTSAQGTIPEVLLTTRHPLFRKIHKAIAKLSATESLIGTEIPRALLRVKAQRDQRSRANRHYQAFASQTDFFDEAEATIKSIASMQVTLHKLVSYYQKFIFDLCNEFGAESDFYLRHQTEVLYLRALLQELRQRQRDAAALFRPISEGDGIGAVELPPDVDAIEASGGGASEHYPLLITWPEDEKTLVPSPPNSLLQRQIHRSLRIITCENVAYKFMPEAPAVNCIVNSLFRALLAQAADPTKILKIGAATTRGLVADKPIYYEASLGGARQSLGEVLYNPIALEQLDLLTYSAACLTCCLLGLLHVTPENVLIAADEPKVSDIVYTSKDDIPLFEALAAQLRKANPSAPPTVHQDKILRVQGFNCDEKMVQAFHEFKQSHRNKVSKENLNVLFLLPQMDEAVHPLCEDYLLGHRFVAEEVLALWLRCIYEQNLRFAQLVREGFGDADFDALGLPITLSEGFVSEVYKRLSGVISSLRLVREGREASREKAGPKDAAGATTTAASAVGEHKADQADDEDAKRMKRVPSLTRPAQSEAAQVFVSVHKDVLKMFYPELSKEYTKKRLGSDFKEGLEISGVVSYAMAYHSMAVETERVKTIQPLGKASIGKGLMRAFTRNELSVDSAPSARKKKGGAADYYAAKYATVYGGGAKRRKTLRFAEPRTQQHEGEDAEEEAASTPRLGVAGKKGLGKNDAFNDSFWRQLTIPDAPAGAGAETSGGAKQRLSVSMSSASSPSHEAPSTFSTTSSPMPQGISPMLRSAMRSGKSPRRNVSFYTGGPAAASTDSTVPEPAYVRTVGPAHRASLNPSTAFTVPASVGGPASAMAAVFGSVDLAPPVSQPPHQAEENPDTEAARLKRVSMAESFYNYQDDFEAQVYTSAEKKFMQESPLHAELKAREAKAKADNDRRNTALSPERLQQFQGPKGARPAVEQKEDLPTPPEQMQSPSTRDEAKRLLKTTSSIYRKEEFMGAESPLMRRVSARARRQSGPIAAGQSPGRSSSPPVPVGQSPDRASPPPIPATAPPPAPVIRSASASPTPSIPSDSVPAPTASEASGPMPGPLSRPDGAPSTRGARFGAPRRVSVSDAPKAPKQLEASVSEVDLIVLHPEGVVPRPARRASTNSAPPRRDVEVDFGAIYEAGGAQIADSREMTAPASSATSPASAPSASASTSPRMAKRPSLLMAMLKPAGAARLEASTAAPGDDQEDGGDDDNEVVLDSIERQAAGLLQSLDFRAVAQASSGNPALTDAFLTRLGSSLAFVPRMVLNHISRPQLRAFFAAWMPSAPAAAPGAALRTAPGAAPERPGEATTAAAGRGDLRLQVRELTLKYSSRDEMEDARRSVVLLRLRRELGVRVLFAVSGRADKARPQETLLRTASARFASSALNVFRVPSRSTMGGGGAGEALVEYEPPPAAELEHAAVSEVSPAALQAASAEEARVLKANLTKALLACTNLVQTADLHGNRLKISLVKLVIQGLCDEAGGTAPSGAAASLDPVKQARLHEEFLRLVLDYPGLVPVALAFVRRRGVGAYPQLLHQLLGHPLLERYEPLLVAMLDRCPELLLLPAADSRLLPCDRVKALRDGAFKFQLLAFFVNFAALPANRHLRGIMSRFSGEEELIVRAAHFGLPATAQELRLRRYALSKRDGPRHEGLLLRLLVADLRGDEALSDDAMAVYELLGTALAARLTAHELQPQQVAMLAADVDVTRMPSSVRQERGISALALAYSRVFQAIKHDWGDEVHELA